MDEWRNGRLQKEVFFWRQELHPWFQQALIGTYSEPGTGLAVGATEVNTQLWLVLRSSQPSARVKARVRPGSGLVMQMRGADQVWGRNRVKINISHSSFIHCKEKKILQKLWRMALIWGFNAETVGHGGDCGERETTLSPKGTAAVSMEKKHTHVAEFPICWEKPEIWIFYVKSLDFLFLVINAKNLEVPCGPQQCRHLPGLSSSAQRIVSCPVGQADGHMGDFNPAWEVRRWVHRSRGKGKGVFEGQMTPGRIPAGRLSRPGHRGWAVQSQEQHRELRGQEPRAQPSSGVTQGQGGPGR